MAKNIEKPGVAQIYFLDIFFLFSWKLLEVGKLI
jgi:hypothetical protein